MALVHLRFPTIRRKIKLPGGGTVNAFGARDQNTVWWLTREKIDAAMREPGDLLHTLRLPGGNALALTAEPVRQGDDDHNNMWRIDIASIVNAEADTMPEALRGEAEASDHPAHETLRPSDKWHCGNGHLQDQATISLIRALGVSDPEAMTWLSGSLYDCGPAFCQSIIDQCAHDGGPF